MTGRLQPGRVHTGDRKLDDIQRQAERTRKAINAMPFSDGVESDLLTFTAGQTRTIVHRLGRTPRGMIPLYPGGTPPALSFASNPGATTVEITSAFAGSYVVWFF